ncbi:polysaccharide pyruvyl transferase family protein [Thermoleptolyngbya sp. C42_A2020_037]|uniref:polysaccharide pyruvyl transferase family protein n=1 Tax=Thermoleptolyngbya sp. C42_A2020_037 TaxID=2747799 RepID=UPI0025E651F6|nr:polysaccharide pyruvyl transferase family protein [Thermoleptolyngbya sp. C42_A2020_037]
MQSIQDFWRSLQTGSLVNAVLRYFDRHLYPQLSIADRVEKVDTASSPAPADVQANVQTEAEQASCQMLHAADSDQPKASSGFRAKVVQTFGRLPRLQANAPVPLCWAATTLRQPYANLGDALSPVIVSALSGLPIVHQRFDSASERLASVGTIGHGLKNGSVHLWGTGIDGKRHPYHRHLTYYERPENTEFTIHALRGPFSARVFEKQGIPVTDAYGDPVMLLPKIMSPATEKTHELGIVVHISELRELKDGAAVRNDLGRYYIPEDLRDAVKIITTLTDANLTALEDRVREMTACKRILSTSLHGLVIAETYGIPCAYFRPFGRGPLQVDLMDEQVFLDHRVRDYYAGMGLKTLQIFCRERKRPTNWERAITAIDRIWQPVEWSPQRLLEAFPLPLAVNPMEVETLGDRALLERIRL